MDRHRSATHEALIDDHMGLINAPLANWRRGARRANKDGSEVESAFLLGRWRIDSLAGSL